MIAGLPDNSAATRLDGPLWGALPFPVLRVDTEGSVLALTPAAEVYLNRAERQAVGHPLGDLIGPAETVAELLARSAERGLSFDSLRLGLPGQPRQDCVVQVAPVGDGTRLIVVQPRELAARLGDAGTGGAARSAIGMAAMLAHEIRNPLAGIAGAAQLLAMDAGPEARELTDLIVEETQRVVRLLDQVETFGDRRGPQAAAVNLHDVADRACASAALGLGGGVTLVRDFDPSLPLAQVDRDQMVQVLWNLIRNAAEAGAGTVRLRTFYDAGLRRRGPYGACPVPLQIEVVDDGPGLPSEVAASAFEPFVSGRENGTGLGLALVAKLVDENGGLVAVDSRPGRTSFRVSLPRATGAE